MERVVVIGVAWPGFETASLEAILGGFPGVNMTTAQKPVLPWNPQRHRLELWQNRLARWNRERSATQFGDIAWFYAPYAEEMIASTPNLKMISITGRAEDVAAELVSLSGTTRGGHRINHFSRTISPEETRDAVLTRSYPKVEETQHFRAALCAVLESQRLMTEAAGRYPDRVLTIDREDLKAESTIGLVRDFVGIDPALERVSVSPSTPPVRQSERLPETDPRRCVVLVPHSGLIHTECEEGLKELERRGYTVRRVGGYAAIDQGRNQMATDALADGFDETLWIDSDVGFKADDVEKLRSHRLPIVCGVYPQKGRRALAIHVMPGSQSITFGNAGGLTEILYAATGFLHVRREAYLRILEEFPLQVCNERFQRPTIPWFEPLVREIDDGQWYLAEDFAFCQRARTVGYKIFADTSIRLWHIGNYRYSWEDAGIDRERFGTFTLNLGGNKPQTPS
ncbi:hypothetical protein [Planctopirus hydrillae]|uniref:hypothetical protein n=1 Tax=Planctopirus hydrillae TaxID=1841610 RepID=UPI00197C695E|nr:hypothetical protein [Planctopirus hydrillae]